MEGNFIKFWEYDSLSNKIKLELVYVVLESIIKLLYLILIGHNLIKEII